MDLITAHQDDVLALLGIPLPTFLVAYKGRQTIYWGLDNLDEEISRANGTPHIEAAASAAAENTIIVDNAKGNNNGEDNNMDSDDAMVNAANAVKLEVGPILGVLSLMLSRRVPSSPSRNFIPSAKKTMKPTGSRLNSQRHVSTRPRNAWPKLLQMTPLPKCQASKV